MMVTDSGRGRHRKHFVKRAETAGQCNGSVASGEHQVLTVAQIVAGYAHVHAGTGLAAPLYYRRNHTYRHAAGLAHGLCHTLHQPEITPAEHQRVPVFAEPPAQLFSRFEISGIDV